MKLSYFPGCSLGSTAKEYDLSARAVCRALGLELVELKDWVCCGATSAHSTNHLLSIALPSRNLALAQEAGMDLAIPCSACYSRVKKADYTMRNNEAMRKEIEDIVEFNYNGKVNVYSLIEALVNNIGVDAIGKSVKKPLTGLKVVCFYGCLLVRPPEVTRFDNSENPVSLDKVVKALGAEAIPWSYKTDCCGANLGLTSSEVVQGMVGRLLEAAQEAGAMAIVTACPLCQSNLEMRRKQRGTDLPAFYFTELIGMALDLPEWKKWLNLHLIDPWPLLRSLSLAG
ncbi:CoB--CoM heterodisulfide reductase iron-sulfur subunit B family protein [Desulfallas sp. Bu1-1]|uniref:CoB--CoM heterodisulfide reductase iron-sulfur subunit B family protein n=1 Tax=Desulfallas sp. Bu1-1 TaxID=2787620 RepID=UPI00189C76D0|nr:CoB--CoM heterodisulfide reductase iron-sulfur subunit B family protein [Desulfallas sp. Bu1-1]MBF7083128.1 CoB--CoM heterodisulfide reductase iron-sulfur subunit B family protein [Desulfallas sp. Bu1-1]